MKAWLYQNHPAAMHEFTVKMLTLQVAAAALQHGHNLTGCSEDPHYQADFSVPQQGHVCVVCLCPVFILFGFEGSPDTNPEHQQVEYDGDYQSWDIESHTDYPGGAAQSTQCREEPDCMQAVFGTDSTWITNR